MSKPKVEIDKASLRLIQFIFVIWSTVILTVAIDISYGDFIPEVRTSDLFGTIMVDSLIFTELHFTIILSAIIVIPLVYTLNRFYKKFLLGFVKVV